MLRAKTLYVKSRFILNDVSGTGGVTPGVKVQSIINKAECSMRLHLLSKMLSLFKTLNTVDITGQGDITRRELIL